VPSRDGSGLLSLHPPLWSEVWPAQPECDQCHSTFVTASVVSANELTRQLVLCERPDMKYEHYQGQG
jgi:hypothetical protein